MVVGAASAHGETLYNFRLQETPVPQDALARSRVKCYRFLRRQVLSRGREVCRDAQRASCFTQADLSSLNTLALGNEDVGIIDWEIDTGIYDREES